MSENRDQTTIPGALPAADPGVGEATGPAFALPEDAVVRRTRDGWRVGGEEVPDLTCAMVLADLLAADMPADAQAPPAAPPPAAPPPAAPPPAAPPPAAADGPAARAPADGPAAIATAGDGSPASAGGSAGPAPARGSVSASPADDSAWSDRQAPAGPAAAATGVSATESPLTPAPATPGPDAASAVASEARRLKATVSQLQYALTARIRVEQAIGVLAERHRIQPRQAFEQLRAAARSRGQKVIDIATDVVASATNPLLQLPDELSRPRSGPRRAARQPRGAH